MKTSLMTASATASTLLLILLVAVVALVVAACGTTSMAAGTSASPLSTAAASPKSAAPMHSVSASGPIAFINGDSLCTIRPDGSGLKRIARPALCAAWSPDGTQLAYGGWKGMFVMQADGSGQRQVVADWVLHGLAWSPDGRQLVFSNEKNHERNLVIVEVDGSGRKALTSPSRRVWDTGPVWSPDGRIFFTRSDRHANIGEIASIAPDGSGLETVTAAEWVGLDVVPSSFSLSPDGKWLLLCDRRAGSWVRMAANGHGAPLVVRKSPGDPRHGGAPQSSWSPDGSRIAFSVYTGGMTSGLFIMKADGSQLRKIAEGNNMQPMWQPR